MEARLAEWEAKNPHASMSERIMAAQRVGDEIKGAIDADKKYNREQVRQLPAPAAEPRNQGPSGTQDAPVPGDKPKQPEAADDQDAIKVIQGRIKALESMGGKVVGKVKVGKAPSNIEMAIRRAAKKHGADEETLKAIAWLESTFDAGAKNPHSSAGGLFQFIDGTAAQYGLKDRFNVDEAADAGARLLIDNGKALNQALGRKPKGGELYLAHQQGAGGAIVLLRQPRMKAVDALQTLKGVSPEDAEERIRLNLPQVMRHRAKDITAGEFARLWTSKIDG
jgi:hypothetical protein